MPLKNFQYDALMRNYNQKQFLHKHEQDERIQKAEAEIPRLSEIRQEIASLGLQKARFMLGASKDGDFNLSEKIQLLARERIRLLREHGYPEDYLELHYDCPDCRDTGYRDGKKCHCFKKREISLLYDQSNIREILSRENFDTFSYEYFDDTKVDERSNKTAREYMRQVVALCRSYVEHFGEHKDNLLFTGKTGLGKTFLSNCIAKELLDQSYSVVYLPAVEMYEIFSKERFDYDSTEEDRDRSRYLLDCDLLIIDDLGTELVNTFTTSQLFYCINERLNRRKGTIISTNLPVNEMRDEFTDRVMSRIVSQYTVIPLYGEDIRIRKKLMQARRQ